MPLEGVRYRVRTYPSGKRVRLAFRGNRVVETKHLPPARRNPRGRGVLIVGALAVLGIWAYSQLQDQTATLTPGQG